MRSPAPYGAGDFAWRDFASWQGRRMLALSRRSIEVKAMTVKPLRYPHAISLRYLPEEAQRAVYIGRLVVDDKHMVAAEPANAELGPYMKELADEINAMNVLHVDDMPPDAKPFESWSRIVKRGDRDFVAALTTMLTERYGFEVEAG